MKIRNVKLGDEIGISNVIVETWKDAYKNIVDDAYLDNLSTEKYITIFKRNISEKLEVIFILEDNTGNLVGFASGKKADDDNYDCELVGIYIIPKYQKHGFGKALFQRIVKAHLDKGYRRMIIWTFEKSRDRAFYARMGGVTTEYKILKIGDRDIPTIGFIWDDISNINYD